MLHPQKSKDYCIQVLSTLQHKAVFSTLESHMSASDPAVNCCHRVVHCIG